MFVLCEEKSAVMSGNKGVELQLQMRQNAEDVQNFMKELDSWEEDIKRKDQQLCAGNINETQVNPLLQCVSDHSYSTFFWFIFFNMFLL